MRLITLLIAFFSFMLIACEKEDKLTHKEGTVEGNNIRPFDGVSDVLINNYINRYYIDLIGVQPSDSALITAAERLNTDPKSIEQRDTLINIAISAEVYYDRFFSITSLIFTEGLERSDFEEKQAEYEAIIELSRANGDSLLVQIFEYEMLKMDSLIEAKDRLQSEIINLNQYFRAFCYNYVYDEINMGSLNFVQACFENLFGRSPTPDELDRGIKMVDGTSTYLFLKGGNSKSDFLNIMISNPEFLVGRTKDVYNQLVQRNPNTSETVVGVQMLQNAANMKDLQVEVAKTKEYAGF
jgi:hypothetical protein